MALLLVPIAARGQLTAGDQTQLLNSHNQVRCAAEPPALVMPALTWDVAAATVAQNYANTCPGLVHNASRTSQYDAATGTTTVVGENIYASTNPVDLAAAVTAWAAEKVYYSFLTNACATGQVCGHYTQLAWANTTAVGCGISPNCSPQTFPYLLVCDYTPAGNYVGQWPYGAGHALTGACSSIGSGPLTRGDLDGDGRADLVWRNSSSGGVAFWLINGLSVASSGGLPMVSDPNFKIAGFGDFNLDKLNDVLWRNQVTGANVIWFMNGGAVASSALLPTVPPPWIIAGVGDFNGDGYADILWHNPSTGDNSIWFMTGSSIASSAALPAVPDTTWVVAGIGDFQGDAKSDIFWHNTGGGQNAVWLMNGGSVAVSAALPTVSDSNWQIAGFGDLQGDGKDDVVWRNVSTGDNAVWFMDGAGVGVGAALPSVPDPTWQIVRIGDFQGDGKADIFWRNSSLGADAVWLMNGPSIAVSATMPTVSDPNWRVVP